MPIVTATMVIVKIVEVLGAEGNPCNEHCNFAIFNLRVADQVEVARYMLSHVEGSQDKGVKVACDNLGMHREVGTWEVPEDISDNVIIAIIRTHSMELLITTE